MKISKQAILVAHILHYTQTLSLVSPQSWKHSSIWNTDISENSAIVYICYSYSQFKIKNYNLQYAQWSKTQIHIKCNFYIL